MINAYAMKEAYANATYWLKKLREALPQRNASDGKRRWCRHCIKQYRYWCDQI
jgi:uncharacterized Zn finger protein